MSQTERDATLNSWTQGYFGTTSLLDEAFDADGTLQEHWRKLLSNAEEFKTDELKNRQQELLNLLKENGVTYNIYGDRKSVV